jgi:GNAT superfamily N-acetyltransferase
MPQIVGAHRPDPGRADGRLEPLADLRAIERPAEPRVRGESLDVSGRIPRTPRPPRARRDVSPSYWSPRVFVASSGQDAVVDESTPEVSAAVLPPHRGRGIGTALLRALGHEAREQGIERLSLSVERDNPAAALYERLGFRPLGREGIALTMVIDLDQPQPPLDF